MSKTRKSDVEEFPDVLVLAAVDRAQRHRQGEPGGPVITGDIYRHLDVRRSSGVGRRLRKRILALEEAGLLEQQRRRGAQVWQLTPAGRRRLRQTRKAGEVGELPESPQHMSWRNAHSTAAAEIERTRGELREHAEELLRLLDSDQVVSSDVWFGLGADLGRLVWVVGSMTHCLCEWREPEDAQAESDEFASPGDDLLAEHERVAVRTRRHGRRNPRLWRA
jgi:hypothetical protein